MADLFKYNICYCSSGFKDQNPIWGIYSNTTLVTIQRSFSCLFKQYMQIQIQLLLLFNKDSRIIIGEVYLFKYNFCYRSSRLEDALKAQHKAFNYL